MAENGHFQVQVNHKMQSPVPETMGNKLASDKNTLLAVLQLLRKYNLKVQILFYGKKPAFNFYEVVPYLTGCLCALGSTCTWSSVNRFVGSTKKSFSVWTLLSAVLAQWSESWIVKVVNLSTLDSIDRWAWTCMLSYWKIIDTSFTW
jgi:hypothetical protein